MNKLLLKVSIRQQALYIPSDAGMKESIYLKDSTSVLIANLARLGFGVSEELKDALNQISPAYQEALLDTFRVVTQVKKNWAPLVKGWDTPTGEGILDHILTFFTNVFKGKGTQLACGHIIPPNTFPLERYNGCPFCGTPFEFGEIENYGQGSQLKVLTLWTQKDVEQYLEDLLVSKTPLDATQMDSLKMLLKVLPLPEVNIGMKETLVQVIDFLVQRNQSEQVQPLFKSPSDVMRYLWYKNTGFLQIIEPRTIIRRLSRNQQHFSQPLENSIKTAHQAKTELKLKYRRSECLMVAQWLNKLPMSPLAMAENMHPRRQMWVRFIRALRLAEYSQRKGFEQLKELLDVFYNQKYTVWQGRLDHFRLKADAENTLALLKQRPGLFARSLFANMLWFGPEVTLAAFQEVLDQIPARLVFTLNMYAENYFNPDRKRSVSPLGGTPKRISAHPLLTLYKKKQREAMKAELETITIQAMKKRFAAQKNENRTIYIDPLLFYMPVAIGDRSENIQDLPSALMGSRFPIEGESIRLLMQWGEGLPAQHLDMDLSCQIAFEHKTEICYYGNLVATGSKHSGDIQHIPNKVGTAEYIDISIPEIERAGASYLIFTCNAYSQGEISPNLTLGWMNSKFPMKISEKTGVAYDPSCVQHQVRISQGLSKGLVFGVYEVASREIIWLEMPFHGQISHQLDRPGVEALLGKLKSKLSIGHLLQIKAQAQRLRILEEISERLPADEVYTAEWGRNAAAVTQLLLD